MFFPWPPRPCQTYTLAIPLMASSPAILLLVHFVPAILATFLFLREHSHLRLVFLLPWILFYIYFLVSSRTFLECRLFFTCPLSCYITFSLSSCFIIFYGMHNYMTSSYIFLFFYCLSFCSLNERIFSYIPWIVPSI